MSINETLARMPDENARIRRKLMRRMGIAALMILALLGSLALFDYLAARSGEVEEEMPPRFTEPVPVPGKSTSEALGPVLPAPERNEEPPPSVPESTETPLSPPITDTRPVPEEITPPASAAAPARPAAATPSTSAPAASAPSVAPTTVPRAATTPSTPTAPTSPTPPAPPRAAEPKAPPPVPESAISPPVSAGSAVPAPARLLPGYLLQAGVFVDPRRAEDVLAQLAQEGIAATLETRVLVGPFKDPAEAQSVRDKMKVLGIEAIPVMRNGKK